MRKDYLPFGKPNFSDREIQAVTRVLRSGWVGMGPETIAFEKELADYIGVADVVTVNSCTSALFLALLVHGIGPGDEVVTPSLTWCSTANAALYLGARPVFCDVDPDTFNVTTETVLKALTPRTKAVMVVHMGGLAVDVDALRRALPPHVSIVEDAAHALAARYPAGGTVGSSGNLACFSFYANKNLSTGEGGAVSVQDPGVGARLRSLRLHALPVDAWQRFSNPHSLLISPWLKELGYKMNFTDLQACIGRVQLTRLAEFNAARLEVARVYEARLSRARLPIGMQRDITAESHARHLFQVLLPVERMKISRDEFVIRMRLQNVGASVHYAPLHQMPLYSASAERLPVTEDLCRRIVTLPISATMTAADANYVADCVDAVLRESD